MNIKIGILGLGYVGLPLAISLQKYFNVLAYDSDKKKINELKNSFDRNNQFSKKNLKNAKKINFFQDIKDLQKCNVYIIAVPTPVNKNNLPDLSILKQATIDVSKLLSKNDTIIYESTVYPGVTEEICVPIIEKKTKLIFNKDFFCGYSPERINPGDKKKTIENIVKITSGSNKKTLNLVDSIYKKISKVGTYKAESIRVAEAAKVIENAQRDINIAFINEVKIIFDKVNINTNQVLKAANTKWNFLNFKPGFVGGHCIGVDPYYLSFMAKNNNYTPKVILSGRKINDNMAHYEAKNFIKKIGNTITKKKILVMGATFKENCKDLRNSKVFDLIDSLKKMNAKVEVFDPIADSKELTKKLKFRPLKYLKNKKFDGIFIAVNHNKFKQFGMKNIMNLCRNENHIYDFKSIFKK